MSTIKNATLADLARAARESASAAHYSLQAAHHAARYIELETGQPPAASEDAARAASFALFAYTSLTELQSAGVEKAIMYDERETARRVSAYVDMIESVTGMSDAELSTVVGSDVRGGADMEVETAVKLAGMTGVSFEWLFGLGVFK